MQLQEIYGMADIHNTASQHVLQKAGLQYIETFSYQGEQMHWYKIVNSALPPAGITKIIS
jgi:RimJ/RimL family protein N-acetyltransferase